jgi:hypothetical protein
MQCFTNTDTLYYITIATKPHKVLSHLKKTISNKNETIHVLGEQENRYIGWEANSNFGVKLREVSSFIKKKSIRGNDIILFTDAYDVAYFGDRNTIIERFYGFNKPIVFGAEKYCFPNPTMKQYYTKIDGLEFPYLNSGMFIGYAWALRELMKGYSYNDNDDDQYFWTVKYLEQPDLISLDHYNDLFLNMNDIDMKQFSFDGNTVFYKKKNPLFIHVNGPDKTMINDFIE